MPSRSGQRRWALLACLTADFKLESLKFFSAKAFRRMACSSSWSGSLAIQQGKSGFIILNLDSEGFVLKDLKLK
uniref:Uncharacterized protein MANES_08G045600 n=1 Tax=Rhizophora mucronata TaxID=61149 RepID=A0A2P2ISL4_RHIMU